MFLFCLSVAAFVSLPVWLSPSLSIWLCPISMFTTMEVALALAGSILPFSLSFCHSESNRMVVHLCGILFVILFFSIQTVNLSSTLYVYSYYALFLFLSWEITVTVIGPGLLNNPSPISLSVMPSHVYWLFIIKPSTVVVFPPMFSIIGDWNTLLNGVLA